MNIIKRVIEAGVEGGYEIPKQIKTEYDCLGWVQLMNWLKDKILFSHDFAECFARWLVENKAKVTKCRLSGNETLTIGDDYITTNGMSIEFAAQQMCIKNWYLTTLATTPDKQREAWLKGLVEG